MKKSDMVCRKCIKFTEDSASPITSRERFQCRYEPLVRIIVDPIAHWCAQGQWEEWSERHECWVSYHWGEHDDKEPLK